MDLKEITALAKLQVEREAEVTRAEQALKDAKEALRRVAEEDLPLALAEVGMQKITLDTGETIEVKLDFEVGIPEERREEAYRWLEQRRFGSLIKTEVSIAFGKGGLDDARALQAALIKKGLTAELARSVHWQTLKAWVKEQTCAEKPLAIPPDLFGTRGFQKSIVKFPKTKQPKP